MSDRDWNAEAQEMALHVAEHEAGRPRGVIEGRQARVSVVFGNEPGRDPGEIENEIAGIRDALGQEGIRVLGFAATPGDAATWAMIVESEDIPLIEEILGVPESWLDEAE